MIKIEIRHHLGEDGKIDRTEKTWRFLGMAIKRKIYYYPKIDYYECVTMV